MLGSVHPRFAPDRMEIWCAGPLASRHAIEVAELMALARTYYHFKQVTLRLETHRITRGASALLRESIATHEGAGYQVELCGSPRLCQHLRSISAKAVQPPRPIGFAAERRPLSSPTTSPQHANRT